MSIKNWIYNPQAWSKKISDAKKPFISLSTQAHALKCTNILNLFFIKKYADNHKHKIYKFILIAVLIMVTGCESRVTPLIEAIDADNTARIRELIAKDPSQSSFLTLLE